MGFLVTGGAGFIGSHVVDLLLEKGNDVAIVDNLTTGLASSMNPRARQLVPMDCADIPEDALGPETVVIHCAAQPKCGVSIFMPEQDAVDNYLPGLKCLTRCLRSSVRRFVLVSSFSVYGEAEPLPYTEEMQPQPTDPYAIHKFALERIALLEGSLHNTEVVVVRPQNVFGPRQRPDMAYRNVIPRWIRRALTGRPLPVFGSLDISRAFSPVPVVARGIVAAATKEDLDGQVFNLGSQKVRSLRDIAGELEKCMSTTVDFAIVDAPATLKMAAYGSVSKAERVLGVAEEATEFEANLRALVEEVSSSVTDKSEEIPSPELMKGKYRRTYAV